MTQPRTSDGKWRKAKRYGLAFTAISLIGIGTATMSTAQTETVQFKRDIATSTPAIIETPEQRLDRKIDTLTNEILDRLKAGETPGYEHTPGELFYTNDPRKVMIPACQRIGGQRPIECDSWGMYQFKITTIIHYVRMLRGQTLTMIEAIVLSQNESEARKLAAEIIVKKEGGIWEWSAAKKTPEIEAWFRDKVGDLRELIEIRDGVKPTE